MIRINLLPVKAAQKKEQLRNQIIIVAATLILVVAACVVTQVSVLSDIRGVQADIKKSKAEIKSLEKKIGEVNKFKALQEELKNKLAVLESLKEAKSGPVHLMDDLIVSLPENLWVTSFKEKSGALTLQGIGLSEDDVADFMTNLESSSFYEKIRLKVTKQKTVGGLRLQVFELSGRVEKSAGKAKQ